MPPSSRRNDTQSDTASIGGNSLATNSTSNSCTTASTSTSQRSKPQPAKRGSFASATASSLARGGPDTKCPAARSASAGMMALPKSSSLGDDSGGSGEKENAENQNGNNARLAGGSSTPSKASKAEDTMAPVLSPTPSWEVLEERGNRSPPRTTRSAAKKDDELDPNDKSSDDSLSSSEDLLHFSLHFSPPDKQLHASNLENARKRKRGAKRPKKGHASLKSEDNEAPNGQQAAAANGPSPEEILQIIQQSLAEYNSNRIEELVAKSAAAERDADHHKRRYEELDEKYNLLDAQVKVKEGSESELSTRCVEQKGLIDGYAKRISELESERNELEERHAKDREEDRDKFEEDHELICDEKERQLEEIGVENEQILAKLESTKVELHEVWSAAQQREATLEAKCATVTAEKESLDTELCQARNDISELQPRVGNLEEELTKSQQVTSTLQMEKEASDQKLTELSSQLQTLTNHLESAQATIAALESKLRAKDEYCEQFSSIEKKLIQEKRVLNDIRRDLHNRVIQLSGNIRVFVRVRPLIESERKLQVQQQQQQSTNSNRRLTTNGPSSSSGRPSSRGSMAPSSGGRPSSRGSMMASSSSHRSLSSTQPPQGDEMTAECPFHFPSITDRNTNASSSASFNDLTKQTIELTEPYKDRGGLNPRRKKWKYGFDRVFHQDDRQDDVWEGAEPLVQSCVDGFHVCMFAYGQTGSGKTHTMIGDAQNRGLIPRAVEKLFAAKQEIEQSRGGEVSVDIRVELLEVYNEEVRDLLDDNAGPQGQLIKLKLSDNEAVGNVKVTARDEKEVEGILQLAQERRCVKATKSNAESSRSHLLFTIHFDVSSTSSRDDDSATIRSGCLHIVDLAGSERLDKSGSHGALLTEAKHINTSLSALALVIEKLQAKKSSTEHIPYRDSRLTYLLRNSLGGDSKTLAIICCSPHQAHFNESLNSIRFAAKASKVELKETNKVDV